MRRVRDSRTVTATSLLLTGGFKILGEAADAVASEATDLVGLTALDAYESRDAERSSTWERTFGTLAVARRVPLLRS